MRKAARKAAEAANAVARGRESLARRKAEPCRSTASCAMFRVDREEDLFNQAGEEGEKAGAFWIGPAGENGTHDFCCRLPDGTFIQIPVGKGHKPEADHPTWWWDGNEDAPTLKPSIHTFGIWHGFFTAGRMVSC